MVDHKAPKKTKTYVLKEGKHFGYDEDGNAKDFEVGDEVELTDTQYEAFKDKFEAPREVKRQAEKQGLAPGEEKHTPTQPQAAGDGKNQASKVPGAAESKPGDGKDGAGAAANSTNTAKT